jgi:hypothetical protein
MLYVTPLNERSIYSLSAEPKPSMAVGKQLKSYDKQ